MYQHVWIPDGSSKIGFMPEPRFRNGIDYPTINLGLRTSRQTLQVPLGILIRPNDWGCDFCMVLQPPQAHLRHDDCSRAYRARRA